MTAVRNTLLVLLWITAAGTAFSQPTAPGMSAQDATLRSEIAKASTDARVKLSSNAVDGLIALAKEQQSTVTKIYATVPADDRVGRVAKYLTAKQGLDTATTVVSAVDDFHWGYLSKNFDYVPIVFGGKTNAKLAEVEVFGSGSFAFAGTGRDVKPAMKFLVPVVKSSIDSGMTVAFDLGNHKAIWTGQADAGTIEVVAAATTKGCEVHVTSKPTQAKVYFNQRLWYQPTNTSVVRDPGALEVLVQLAGYKDYRVQQTLSAGQTWNINAPLVKQ